VKRRGRRWPRRPACWPTWRAGAGVRSGASRLGTPTFLWQVVDGAGEDAIPAPVVLMTRAGLLARSAVLDASIALAERFRIPASRSRMPGGPTEVFPDQGLDRAHVMSWQKVPASALAAATRARSPYTATPRPSKGSTHERTTQRIDLNINVTRLSLSRTAVSAECRSISCSSASGSASAGPPGSWR
jgi:hypothetical protein